jgi:succinyl-diaminopimelate desuccinylase
MTIRIDDEYATSLLTSLVDIPSAYPEEYDIMLFLEEEFKRLGLDPKRIHISERRFNLLASIGEGSPVLCLNAHADTVQASGKSVPSARIEGDVLYGLGSMDDKGSIVAIMAGAKAILDSGVKLKGRLDILISVDEEGDARGVKAAIEQGYKCDMAITGEGTSLHIVPRHCGLIFLEIVTHGVATHGSIPMEGINAIERMYELVAGLRAVVTDYAPDPMVGPPTLNLGIIHGGDRPNRVCDRCEASVDIRLVPPMTVDLMLERIADYFKIWGDRAEYKITKQVGPLNTPVDSPLVAELIKANEKVRGFTPEVVGWRGWTEAQSFQSGLGIDSVDFGPGALKQAHSANEFVELDEVRQAAQVCAQFAVDMLV